MRKIVFILACLSLAACTKTPFSGFVVCKEYTPAYMSDKNPNTVTYAGVVYTPRVVVHHRTKPHKIASKWELYVADRNRVVCISVDSIEFTRIQLGQRYTIHW